MDDIQGKDMVNHPDHYTKGGIECIEAIQASMTMEEFAGYLKGNVLKYLWRFESKENPSEDLAKANWYLDRLQSVTTSIPNMWGGSDSDGDS